MLRFIRRSRSIAEPLVGPEFIPQTFANYVRRRVLIVTFAVFCWLAMQAVHELGHVVAAWLTGGGVEAVVLHPLVISRTDVSPNPQPLPVAWAGAIVGSTLPLAVFGFAQLLRIPNAFLARAFAGFCLLVNGIYLGVGWIGRVGDAGDLLRHGASVWQLGIFGLLAVPLGLYLWNGLGPEFGIGAGKAKDNRSAVVVSTLLLTGIITIEMVVTWIQ